MLAHKVVSLSFSKRAFNRYPANMHFNLGHCRNLGHCFTKTKKTCIFSARACVTIMQVCQSNYIAPEIYAYTRIYPCITCMYAVTDDDYTMKTSTGPCAHTQPQTHTRKNLHAFMHSVPDARTDMNNAFHTFTNKHLHEQECFEQKCFVSMLQKQGC